LQSCEFISLCFWPVVVVVPDQWLYLITDQVAKFYSISEN